MIRKILCSVLLLLAAAQVALAQQKMTATAWWSDVAERNLTAPAGFERLIVPQKYRTVALDVAALETLLPMPGTSAELVLPTPTGEGARFLVTPNEVMAPGLRAKYPQIQTYSARGIDDPSATAKLDLTPWGFHAMIRSSQTGVTFIDPYFFNDASKAVVYFKKDYRRNRSVEAFDCMAADESALTESEELTLGPGTETATPDAGDCKLRTYRLALACTGEYAAFHGGNVPQVLAAMVTSVNRVNEVYEADVAVTMQLIENTDTLIFLNSSTDPYTNNNGSTMLGQNQTTVTQRIGAANYDIGHVFSTGGGGVAGLGVVCSNGSKARGVTGSGSPVGDAFDIDYVAHEMGHQFGGNHTFNNSCGGNINSSTAMEPGSGTTVMGYAGICAPDIQAHSDAYFHAISIQEIQAYITTGTGNNCPVKTVTGNNAPTVNNVANYTIPKSTPFSLTAIANDPDGDPLTYCWEQMDPQSATMPPVSTNTGGPMFRSFPPTDNPTRYFPRLSDLLSNTNYLWEELPSVARTMKFRVTVRDNFPGASCTAEDDVTITVANSGPFVVTVPNTNVTWNVSETQAVTWNVAGTDAAPVSCSNVRILLSTDGGNTFPIVLAENVPNNGTANVVVPNNVSTTCRVKVEAIGNVFFDISNVNFRIQLPPTPSFTLNTSTAALAVCAGQSASVNLTATSLVGFNLPVDFTVTGAPVGASLTFSPNPLTPTGTSTLTFSDLTPAMAGTYTLGITAVGGNITQTATLSLTVLPGAPETTATAVSPTDGTSGVGGTVASLEWSEVEFASTYTVEVASSPDFAAGNIVATWTGAATTTTVEGLTLGTPYYWRVKASNSCGQGDWSAATSFQTGSVPSCDQVFNSTNVPLDIDVNGEVNVVSSLEVASNLVVSDVNATLDIAHTWVGDLDVWLVSPAGDSVQLFNRPGEPADQFGCDGDNLALIFDDEAAQTAAILEAACNGTAPALSGTFQATSPLSIFDNKSANGTWQLVVNDNYPGEDAGAINAWSLTFCLLTGVDPLVLTNNEPLTLNAGTSKAATNANIGASVSGTAAEVRFTLLTLPAHGVLSQSGVNLAVGSTFTQDDINTGKIVYTHGGDAATSDACTFDVFDSNNSSWLHNSTLNIVIVQNTLVSTSAQTAVVLCHNAATGEITVTATGGTAPLTYSLNGGTGQSSPVFSGLAPGTYTPVVTDANGFTSTTGSITIANPTAISVATSVSEDDLTVTATGGNGPLSYSVNGVDFQATGDFSNLPDNIYTVTVEDSVGCQQTTEVIVSVGTLLANVSVLATPACYGEPGGILSVNVAGGVAPYHFSIVADSTQELNIFGGLAAGSYTVTVTDDSGNTTVTTAAVVDQPNALEASATATLNVVTVAATGGTGSYQYSLDGGDAQSSATFGNVSNGDHTVLVTDANGCQVSTTVTVVIPPLTIAGLASTIPADCDGVLGNLFVNAEGGIPPYEYSLDGSAWQTSNVFYNIAPGEHVFEVRDAVGTVSEGLPLTIVAPVPLVASAQVLGNDVSVSVSGGELPYFYNLPGNGQNLANGNYTVTVTDSRGCTTTVGFTISYQAPSLTAVTTNVACFGESTGSVAVSLVGGIQPFTYQYSPALPWTNVPAGTYSLTVTDGAGTTASASATVSQPNLLVASASTTGDDISVAVTGGTSPFQYSLNGGAFQNSNVFANNLGGDYVVTVRDANGCTTTDAVIVTGTVEPTREWGLQVAPNPSNGLFTLSLNTAPTGNLLLETLDATGRLLQHEVFELVGNQWQTSLDLSQMPAGVYVLRLTTGARTGAVRLTVVK